MLMERRAPLNFAADRHSAAPWSSSIESTQKTGDAGTTGLGDGVRVPKFDLRVESYGTVDETNSAIGLARLHTAGDAEIDGILARIQNDLFDLGADLCTPDRGQPLGWGAIAHCR